MVIDVTLAVRLPNTMMLVVDASNVGVALKAGVAGVVHVLFDEYRLPIIATPVDDAIKTAVLPMSSSVCVEAFSIEVVPLLFMVWFDVLAVTAVDQIAP